MKLDVDPFPVNTVGFEAKKILVRSNQAETTKGKNVVVLDELRQRMIKPKCPEVGVWKDNVVRRLPRKVKPTCDMLIDKYVHHQQQCREMREQTLWFRQDRAFGSHYKPGRHNARQRTMFPRSPGIGEHGSGSRRGWDGHEDQVMVGHESAGRMKLLNVASRAQDVVMIGSITCRLASKVHVDG
jgi:hypothetical protein